jgi:hypothetical protein
VDERSVIELVVLRRGGQVLHQQGRGANNGQRLTPLRVHAYVHHAGRPVSRYVGERRIVLQLVLYNVGQLDVVEARRLPPPAHGERQIRVQGLQPQEGS